MANKIPRQKMPEQKPQVRRNNFNEVPLGYPEETALLEASRCLQCKKPACVEGCPVGVNIPAFIQKISEKDYTGSLKAIKETNSLPAVCGRVCPQETQCEERCILAKKSEPVAIGKLERFVADYERDVQRAEPPKPTPSNGKKIAVIGSGPAGLTAAGDLAGMGYEVTIFEALHNPGGVLVYGIPEFRLPKAIVQYEIEALQKRGVRLSVNRVIGIAETVNDLFDQGYGAVFIGTGAGLPKFLNVPGENLQGVYSANEYLTRINLMKAYMFPKYDTPVIKGKNVAVFGGGNVAMDSARTALRLGADNVYLVYRRSRTEMPAREEEIHHAEEEGINFMLLHNPVKFIGNDQGRLTAMECQRMELGAPDDSGRRRPVPVPGALTVTEIDVAVVAIGNDPNPIIQKTTPDLGTSKWGNIIADGETMKTSKRGVFAGGDIVSGAATVIEAMGAGRKAAKAIHEYLESNVW
ncbi:MAG: glutamate synthase (NADPH), homotetrameric [Spirochaetae bacterium HGW-Spirochaetae-1]|jgi:glutamate synthase (NADPH/NADH) small chain|nr:MAG: glutamate synthase (NADPH), homotetrameric [Spirochaetae bacterium HGW-Spirochaetae-1]